MIWRHWVLAHWPHWQNLEKMTHTFSRRYLQIRRICEIKISEFRQNITQKRVSGVNNSNLILLTFHRSWWTFWWNRTVFYFKLIFHIMIFQITHSRKWGTQVLVFLEKNKRWPFQHSVEIPSEPMRRVYRNICLTQWGLRVLFSLQYV